MKILDPLFMVLEFLFSANSYAIEGPGGSDGGMGPHPHPPLMGSEDGLGKSVDCSRTS